MYSKLMNENVGVNSYRFQFNLNVINNRKTFF